MLLYVACNALNLVKMANVHSNGDNHIQNYVLLNNRLYIRQHTSQNENFEYSYPSVIWNG